MENTKDTMKECMKEDNKALVSIVLALYNPNLKWLKEQLLSINEQTYKNIELLIMDDCSNAVFIGEIKSCIEECITEFDFKFFTKSKNEGSNKTFEKLTQMANGDYIAYCDQDDIWEKSKIETLLKQIRKHDSELVYSDMQIIDEKSNVLATSLKAIRPRLEYLEGNNLGDKFIFSNCIAGCSMLVKSSIAKKSIPFHNNTICDQWVAIFAAYNGEIKFLNKTLVRYRQHDKNQTGILDKVFDKKTYYENRLESCLSRIEYLENKVGISEEVIQFCKARKEKKLLGIYKYRNLCKKEAYFEIAMIVLPNFIIKLIMKFIKRNSD